MQNKLAIRLLFGLLAIAVLVVGWQLLSDFLTDPDWQTADTAGYLAAVELKDNGSQVVLFRPDGTKIASPEYVEGKEEREPAWSPDGNRLYFTANREGDAFQIYRWNPAANRVQARSFGTRSRSAPWLGPDGVPTANTSAMILSGGTVLQLDLREGTTVQVLPPLMNELVTEGSEGGTIGQVESFYRNLGTSFKSARYGPNRDYVLAVLRGENGEVLIFQRLNAETPQELQPVALLAGDDISFEMLPDGGAVAVQRGFRWPPDVPLPETIQRPDGSMVPTIDPKTGVARTPWRHAVLKITIENGAVTGLRPLGRAASLEDGVVFADPAVSPDGEFVAVVLGALEGFDFTPIQLMAFPVADGRDRVLARGQLRNPAWHPNGETIAYTERVDGEARLMRVDLDGTNREVIAEGEFQSPVFSPQSPSE